MSSHWRTSLQKVQKGATARIELATSCTQSRNHTTRPRRLSRTLEPPVANRSARKRGKARERRDRRIETQNVRPTSPANATPHLLGGPSRQREISSPALFGAFQRGRRSRVLRVEAGRTRGQCAPRRPPVARAEAGHRPASARPPEPRGYGVAASIGGLARVEKSPANSSTARVVPRDLFGTDGDLRPADGVRGARGDGGARASRLGLGNPPRLAFGARARVVSRPSFRARRPRRRASASRPSAPCKVARGARAT